MARMSIAGSLFAALSLGRQALTRPTGAPWAKPQGVGSFQLVYAEAEALEPAFGMLIRRPPFRSCWSSDHVEGVQGAPLPPQPVRARAPRVAPSPQCQPELERELAARAFSFCRMSF